MWGHWRISGYKYAKYASSEFSSLRAANNRNMHRSSDSGTNPQYGWSSTSLEYFEHVNRMQRMPSMISDDAPSVPRTIPSSLRDKVIHEDEPVLEDSRHQQLMNHQRYPLLQRQEVPQKKVQFTEQKKTTEVSKEGKGAAAFAKKDVDKEADGFIKQKHRKFDMLKWGTFKVS